MTILGVSPFALSLRKRGGPLPPPPPPPSRTIVFAALGQSNMVGRASFDGGSVHPAGVLQWGRVAPNDGVLIPASAPLEHRDPNGGAQPTPHMGLDIGFAQGWLAANPTDTLVFVPSADGGTALNTGFWQKGGAGYDDAVARINACMAANPGFVFGGFLWHQGESDAGVANYAALLDQMIADFRADVAVADATTPFILGELGQQFATSGPGATATNDIILDTPNRVPYTTVVSSTSPQVLTQFDSFHFDSASLRTLGQRYAPAVSVAATRPLAAPDAFAAGDWTLADAASGGALTLAVSALPDQNGAALSAIEYRVDGGAYQNAGLTAPGSIQLTGLVDDVAVGVEIRALNAAGAGPASDVKTATPTTNTAVEPGAVGHWLLGADNPGHDGLTGGALTPVGAAPTLGAGVITTANGTFQGLESPLDAMDEMTVCVVCSYGVGGGAVLAGNFAAGNGCGLWMFSTPGDFYLRDRDGLNGNRRLENDTAPGGMMFAAFSVSNGGGAEIVFRGDQTGSLSIETPAGARTAHASKLGIGNTRYSSGSFAQGADYAEFIVFDGHRTVAELEAIYQRSRARMADRGVAIF